MNEPPTTPNVAPDGEREPKKYIRTFASDLEMAEKGNTPQPTSLPTTPPPPTVPPPPPPQPAVVQSKPPPLQTYASDFSDRMKKTQASTATVLAAEQDSLPPPPTIPPTEPSRVSLSYALVGLALVAASMGGVYLAYLRFTATGPVTSPPVVPAPILVDEREELFETGPALTRAIAASVGRPIKTGSIRFLYTASSTDVISVFASLPLLAPDTLLRNISVKGSMAGVVNVGGNQSPFFILSVSAYSNVFSALLSWEPLMPSYLSELFPPFVALNPSPEQLISSSTTSTTTTATLATTTAVTAIAPEPLAEATSTSSSPTSDGAFFDATIINHDVRVYRDSAEREVFLYGFWNQATLIIARDSVAFAEIVSRLATSRTP